MQDKLKDKFNSYKEIVEKNNPEVKLKLKGIYNYDLQSFVFFKKKKELLHLYYKPSANSFSLKYHHISDEELKNILIQNWEKLNNNSIYDNINIYIDGSFYKDKVSWAFIVVNKGKIIYKTKGESLNKFKSNNITGEIEALKHAILWCKDNSIKEVNIHYDYIGLEKWAKGEWKAKNEQTKAYKEFINNLDIKINWYKIKSHTGNYFNEQVDKLTRQN